MSNSIRVGTSGWSYPSGRGTWNGIFYPVSPGRRARGAGTFDELRFYAEHFDTVEINSTFYGVPAPATVKGWAERTPPDFEFSLKLYQKFTHPGMFLKATGKDPWSLGEPDVDLFRAAIDPLASAGKLGALLAQFPQSFRNEPDSRAYLEWLLQRFRDYPVAIELRHRSWSDEPLEMLQLLDAFGAAWAQIDEPKFQSSIQQDLAASAKATAGLPADAATSAADQGGNADVSAAGPGADAAKATAGQVRTFYYLRLHGRNAAQWWRHEKSEDRYNYLYSAGELKPFAEAAREATREVKKAYLYANNHFSAKSVANAAILKHDLGQPLPGEYPQALVDRYPDLKGLVRVLPELPDLLSHKPS